MATQKFTYTIKHPAGIAVTFFSINYKAHDRKALDRNMESTSEGYTIKGDIELTSSSNLITVRIEASGSANLKFSYNLKFKDKAVFSEDVELTTNMEGVMGDTRKNISLP